MASFSFHARRAIEDFAASLSLPARPAADGSFTFRFDRSGTLSLTPATDGNQTLISLARLPLRPDAALERRALTRAGLDPTTTTFMHAGLAKDGSIVFVLSVPDGELSMQTLESSFRQLVAAQDAIA